MADETLELKRKILEVEYALVELDTAMKELGEEGEQGDTARLYPFPASPSTLAVQLRRWRHNMGK